MRRGSRAPRSATISWMDFPSNGQRASPQLRKGTTGPVSGLARFQIAAFPPLAGQWLDWRSMTACLPLRGQRRHSTGFPYIRSPGHHTPAPRMSLETTFKRAAYPLTGHAFSNRVGHMDAEFSSLEEKLDQLVQRLEALRAENRELRQQLAARTDETSRLGEKLAAAKTRIEALLKQIPETES